MHRITAPLGALLLMSGMAMAQSPADGLGMPGTLTSGTAATFAPFEYQVDGSNTGFDIDLIQAVAEAMGVKSRTLNIDFGGLIPALQGRRIDVINSGMYINPARAAQVDFVPYMRIGDAVVVRQGNPAHVTGRDGLCGHTVAVTLGGIEETYAREDAATCEKAGKAKLTVMSLPTAQDSALALRQGRAEALYNSTPGVAVMLTQMAGQVEVAGPTFANGTQIGIAVRKGDTVLHDAIAAAVKKVVADGTYARLLKKYDLPASSSIF